MHPTMRSNKRGFPFIKFIVVGSVVTLAFLATSAAYFYFTNKSFALEIQQVRAARPVSFNMGIDVSQTIASDVLSDFKEAAILQLKALLTEHGISYTVSVFGLPGCGGQRFAEIVATRAPADEAFFAREVEKRICAIAIAHGSQDGSDEIPLTTPIYRFLEKVLPANPGERVIILSDLVNDNRGCGAEDPFPEQALVDFGAHKKGQIIFYYPTPALYGEYDTPRAQQNLLQRQANFIERVQALSRAGKVRAFFYHVPDDPAERKQFMRAHLEKSIPKTDFQILWERVSKVAETYIHGFRG